MNIECFIQLKEKEDDREEEKVKGWLLVKEGLRSGKSEGREHERVDDKDLWFRLEDKAKISV